MPMTSIFRNRGADNIATFSFSEISSGVGYVEFYLGYVGNGDQRLILVPQDNSQVFRSFSPTEQASPVLALDHDYDFEIQDTVTFEGEAYINVPIAAHNTGTTNDISIYIIAKIRKWNGSSETDLSSGGQSATLNLGATSEEYSITQCNPDISRTTFKKGETLRVTIEVWYSAPASTAGTVKYATNPANRTNSWDSSGAVPSRSTVWLPIILET